MNRPPQQSIYCTVPEACLEPDVAMPLQGLRERPAEPERLLIMAVLCSALHDLQLYADKVALPGLPGKRAAAIVQDVHRWTSGRWYAKVPFDVACEVSGINASRLRKALAEGTVHGVPAMRKRFSHL